MPAEGVADKAVTARALSAQSSVPADQYRPRRAAVARKVASCSLTLLICSVFWSLGSVAQVWAMPPSETLLPDTTKGYLSVPDITLLRDKWNATQVGELVNDPSMEPFIKDVQRQLKARMDRAGSRIGITWDDLEGVYGGEVCIAAVQPWDAAAAEAAIREAGQRAAAKAKEARQNAQQIADAQAQALAAARLEQDRRRQEQHALVLLVDVTGHTEQAQALLTKIAGNLVERGAKQSTATIEGVTMTALEVPVKRDNKVVGTHTAYYCVHQDILLATDHQQVAAGILRRIAGNNAGVARPAAGFRGSHAEVAGGFRPGHAGN